MNKQLILVRHAKSDWSLPEMDDYDRPLSGRGIVDCARMGQWLNDQGCIVDGVLSSSALRTWQTTEAIAYALGIGREKIRYDRKLYLADANFIVRVLKEQPENLESLILVGHNPGLDQLLIYLAAKQIKLKKNEKLLTTASIAILSIPGAWKELSAKSCNLSVLKGPREL